MAHRAEQIITRIAELHEAASVPFSVYIHRTFSMSEDERELPAVSITYGDDQPQTDNMEFTESLLAVRCIHFSIDRDEQALRESLLSLRRQNHVVMQADITLGLDFVSDCRYGGALDPQIIGKGKLTGALECRWFVLYRMNRLDPAD